MKTSYFAKAGKLPNAVSIARSVPKGWNGRQCLELAPPWSLLNQFKLDGDQDQYTIQYKRLVLDRLDPEVMFKLLGEDAILLCWEAAGKFCHRRLVANWFEDKLKLHLIEL
jgi:hypothetical protein